jgi:hypothetical protein
MMLRGKALSIGLGVGGAACLCVTALMNRHMGSTMGATAEGQALLSAGSIIIDLVGLTGFGIATGALAGSANRVKKWLAIPTGLVMVVSAGLSITSIMNFVAAERVSVQKARAAQQADIDKRRQAQADAAKARQTAQEQAAKDQRDTQAQLAKQHLTWMETQMKGASPKAQREMRKDMNTAAADVIAKVGQSTAVAPAPSTPDAPLPEPIVIVRSESGAELIAEITGLDAHVVQLTQMAWLAVLLIVIKAFSFPLSALFWPRDEQQPIPLAAPRVVDAIATEVFSLTAPQAGVEVAPIDDGQKTTPIAAEVSKPAAAKLEPPKPPAAPIVRELIPGAAASLEAINFDPRNRPEGVLRRVDAPKDAARRLITWMRAHDLSGNHTAAQIVELHAEFCGLDHRELTPTGRLLEAVANDPAVRKRRPMVNGKKAPQWQYEVSPGRFKAPKSQPEPQGAQVVRPRAFFEQVNDPVIMRMQAHWERRNDRARKQRGARSGRRAA